MPNQRRRHVTFELYHRRCFFNVEYTLVTESVLISTLIQRICRVHIGCTNFNLIYTLIQRVYHVQIGRINMYTYVTLMQRNMYVPCRLGGGGKIQLDVLL